MRVGSKILVWFWAFLSNCNISLSDLHYNIEHFSSIFLQIRQLWIFCQNHKLQLLYIFLQFRPFDPWSILNHITENPRILNCSQPQNQAWLGDLCHFRIWIFFILFNFLEHKVVFLLQNVALFFKTLAIKPKNLAFNRNG